MQLCFLPYAKLLNLDFVWVHPSATVQNATLAHALNTNGVPTVAVEMGNRFPYHQAIW